MRATIGIAGSLIAISLVPGCGGPATENEDLARSAQAANICNETVPSNRFVDGIPAYAQCSSTTNSAIYSNNGIDTATTSGGTGWVRTQGSGGYQCTELAHRYLYFHWNVSWIPNGNAGTWCDTIPPTSSGLVQTTTPVHGDLIVFAPGVCGADSSTGHVAIVDVVASATTVTIVEENSAGRRNCASSCATCYLHVVANDGTSGSGGASGTGGGSSTGGTNASAGGLPSTGTGTGGNKPTGGASSTGGTSSATGGTRNSGGATSTNGTRPSTGGSANTGGLSSSGGMAVNTGGSSADVTSTGGNISSDGSGGAATGGQSDATAGSSADAGGQSAAAGSGSPSATDAGSCSCGVVGKDGDRHAPMLALALAALGAGYRRRRQASALEA